MKKEEKKKNKITMVIANHIYKKINKNRIPNLSLTPKTSYATISSSSLANKKNTDNCDSLF